MNIAVLNRYIHHPLVLAIFCAIPFIFLAAWNSWTPYSYWLDELYSVTGSLGNLQHVVDKLLGDVHPPLYQIFLKFWIDFIGHSESQTRSLSFLAAIFSMAILIFGLRYRPISFILPAVLIFGSSWLFSFYAQETRSYALLLFFATTATLINLNRANEQDNQWRFAWYAILLAMALTHYFGLIYAGLLLLVDILRVRNIKLFWERIILGGSMLIWPLIHYSSGSVSDKTGGNFWITSSGVETTVLTFAQALFPGFAKIIQIFPVLPWTITWIFIAIILLLLLVWCYYKATEPTTQKEILRLFVLIIAFVGIVAVIDRHTPISTQRNFIVLLPAITLLFANVFNTFWINYNYQWQKVILVLLISGYVLVSSYISLVCMQNRWEPTQNWKSLAEIVYVSKICEPHCWFVGNFNRAEIFAYYFSESMDNNPASFKKLSELTVMPMENHLPIIVAHAKESDRRELEKHYSNWSCLEPLQSWRGSVFLLVPNILSAPEGLRSCP